MPRLVMARTCTGEGESAEERESSAGRSRAGEWNKEGIYDVEDECLF